ncbi:AI-2E family transporter [Pedobacter flavus]|uniref:AI-2E family transporter n=1 Tax=Pedobacter flavus TaxID=3113906 RepID=A0ABU7H4L2_9SPHI|nr:AI-2E family transporter [Pedobacter sp. VNH31]MEE1885496.1 AI-2E family transporter [Pedobacter sp. VNH31]
MNGMPITVKRSIELLGLCLVVCIIVLGQNIIMPVLMAFFISIMLLPIYRFLKKKRFPEIIAIVLPILFVFAFIGVIIWFFYAQISFLVSDFPEIKRNVNLHLTSLSKWISNISHYSTKEQIDLITQKSDDLLALGNKTAGSALLGITNSFVFLGLLPIYIYLMLFYKDILLRFIFMWFKPEQHFKVKEAIYETESMVKNYLVGLLIQIIYITVLLGGSLYLFDIKHALLIGVIFALLNLIPYVGALIGNIIGVLLTLTSSQDGWQIVTVLVAISVVQFFDNNILMPRIVGSKVKINALMAILGVFIGGSVAGISGMFLSIPIIATLKIIFDRSEIFKQWGALLGDERPNLSPMSFPIFRKKNKIAASEDINKEVN